jgi:hypothetical protein
MNPKKFVNAIALFITCMFAAVTLTAAQAVRTSGVYLTATDYENKRLAFAGDCGSKTHKLTPHDFPNKPFIDVKHESEKHRYAKSDLFGFRECDGQDYRFGSNLNYQILEAGELYIYARDVWVSRGRTNQTVRKYYFSVGDNGQILMLNLENLKGAFPENHRFHDWLDATFGDGQNLADYDKFHKMFRINHLLIASR